MDGTLLYRSAEGAWADDYGPFLGFDATLEDGHVVVRTTKTRDRARLPKDPFCPDTTRPLFQYADDGTILVRSCVALDAEYLQRTGPYEARDPDGAIVTGRFENDAEVGEFVVHGADGGILASGRFERGEPVGTWTYAHAGVPPTVDYAKGLPIPAAMDGSLAESESLPGPMSEASLEVLDVNFDRGTVGWRALFEDDFSQGELDNAPCRYPGVEDPKGGVLLGLTDLSTGDTKHWIVYGSAADLADCTTADEASRQLAAAKAAYAAAGLDPTRKPAPAASLEGRLPAAVAGHVLTATQTEDVPPAAVQYGTPWLVGNAPYAVDLAGDHQYFDTLSIDGTPRFMTWLYATGACAGSGSLHWGDVYADAGRVVVVYAGMWSHCDGSEFAWHFSPVLTVPS